MFTAGRYLASSALLLLALGCATSQDIVANPGVTGRQYKSAYLVAHNDKSADVDAAIQRELFRRGIAVSSGPDGKQPPEADLIVKYADSWSWDVTMYLVSLDIQMFDAKSGNLVATAKWKNSAMHGWHGLESVVSDLVGGMFTKLGISAKIS
jgi:hypothetical protein